MKRIIAAMVYGIFVSMFFTGCNSIVASTDLDPGLIQSSVAADETTSANNSEDKPRINYTDEERNKELPDYFAQNMESKFQGLTGKQAFQIKEGHSAVPDDIESFQIGDLREDGTFIYAYVTRLENGGKPRPAVHCVAMYNYKSQQFRVIHETQYQRSWENVNEQTTSGATGEESFFFQVCPAENGGSGDIFVYDNGHGYLYKKNGDLKFHADIEAFIRKQYPGAYDVAINKAMTDGNNRVYMELSVEYDEIATSQMTSSGGDESEEELDRQAEELNEQFEEKVSEAVVVYSFNEINSDISQDNESLDQQFRAWQDMTDGVEYDSPPDALADWNQVLEQYPTVWSGAVLTDFYNSPLCVWNNGESFRRNGRICLFLLNSWEYSPFRDLKANTELSGVFTALYNVWFCKLYGNTGRLESYNYETVKRSYTLVTTTETTNEEGETVTETSKEERWQTLGTNRSRKTKLEKGYIEAYRTMDQYWVSTLGNMVGSDIVCCGKNGTVSLIRPGGSLYLTSLSAGEDIRVGAIQTDEGPWFVIPKSDKLILVPSASVKPWYEQDRSWLNSRVVIDYSRLSGGYEEGSSAYDKSFASLNNENMGKYSDVYSGGAYYTEENIVQASLTVDQKLAAALRERGLEGIWSLSGSSTRKGFLLTSRNRGLTYYDMAQRKAMTLANGCWYRTWKQGENFVSVGFLNGDTSYGAMDVAFARVYEYNLDNLCRESMESALSEALAKEEEEARKASEEAARKSTEREDVHYPMEEWNEEYKDKYSQQ